MATAYDFFAHFKAKMAPEEMMPLYRKGGSKFTEAIIKIIEEIINDKDVFGYDYGREYYRIDVSGWVDRKVKITEDISHPDLEKHLWDLMIAVEHENDPNDWTDELIKLAHVRCPIKVIIGYSPCDQREEDEQRKLMCAAAWLKKLKVYDTLKEDELLLILGNSAPKCKGLNYESFDYRGYLYNWEQEEFLPVD